MSVTVQSYGTFQVEDLLKPEFVKRKIEVHNGEPIEVTFPSRIHHGVVAEDGMKGSQNLILGLDNRDLHVTGDVRIPSVQVLSKKVVHLSGRISRDSA